MGYLMTVVRYRRGGRDPKPPILSSEEQLWQTLLRGLGGEYADMASVSQELAEDVVSLT
jgi:hypothetical protein